MRWWSTWTLNNDDILIYFVGESLDLVAVAGYKAGLPCDIDPPTKDEVVTMVLWYREEISKQPIYSVDARGRNVLQARLWSDPKSFGDRATMRTGVKPAELEIDPVMPVDHGIYRCRVDFRDSPTKNYKINLTIIGKNYFMRVFKCKICKKELIWVCLMSIKYVFIRFHFYKVLRHV